MTGDELHPIPAVGSLVWVRIHREHWVVVEVAAVGADGGLDFIDDEGGGWGADIEKRGESWRLLEEPPPEPATTFPARDQIAKLMIAGAKAERERIVSMIDGRPFAGPLIAEIEATAISVDPSAVALSEAKEAGRVQ